MYKYGDRVGGRGKIDPVSLEINSLIYIYYRISLIPFPIVCFYFWIAICNKWLRNGSEKSVYSLTRDFFFPVELL